MGSIKLVVAILVVSAVCTVSSPLTLHREKRFDDNLRRQRFNFDCSGRPIGFYADVDTNCQVFHLCDAYGVRIPYRCPNNTGFSQQYRICDYSYNFNCQQDTQNWYFLNDLTYATDSPPDLF